jgi:hypothetical protein
VVEQAFVTSLIKSDGSTIAAFAWPAFVWVRRKLTGTSQAAAPQA